MKTQKQIKTGQAPSMETAIERVSAAADSSMLPQYPYAQYVAGFGWVMDSTCSEGRFSASFNDLPSGLKTIYPVAVLPKEYFRQ